MKLSAHYLRAAGRGQPWAAAGVNLAALQGAGCPARLSGMPSSLACAKALGMEAQRPTTASHNRFMNESP